MYEVDFGAQGTRLIQVVYKLETAKSEPRILIKFYTYIIIVLGYKQSQKVSRVVI